MPDIFINSICNQRLRRALAVVPAIEFYRYEVSFKLVKV